MKSPHWLTWLGCLLVLALASGCASGGKTPDAKPPIPEQAPEESPEGAPKETAEVDPAPAKPELDEPTAEPPEEVEEPEAEADTGAYGPKTVVVPGPEEEPETQARTLAEAARSARERRGGDGQPIAVITDETLSEFATGDLTVATKPAATTPHSDDTQGSILSQEEYWRTRVREARIEWKQLTEEISQLESDAAGLRNRFYAEDDGFFRDSQVKPAWDRALDRLSETQLAVVAAQANVQAVLEEGRRAGALPGWLREGLEYEPTQDDGGRGSGIHEPGEPRIVEEDGGR